MIIIIEGDEVAVPVATPEPPAQASEPKPVAARKPLENHAARAKVGDLVRYTPFFPEHAGDLVTGVIVRAWRTWMGNFAWKIRALSEEDGSAYFVRRYSSGGTLMIIREGADITHDAG
jgi:hypothetical protein